MPKFESEYYREKNAAEKEKLHELQKQLPEYMESYLTDLELSRQNRTAIAYTRELLVFLRFIKESYDELGDTPERNVPFEYIKMLTYDDINRYQQWLSYNHTDANNHNCGEATIARAMSAIRRYYHFELVHERLDKDPTVGAAKRTRVKTKPIERLDIDETNKLMKGIENNMSGTERSQIFSKKTQLRDTAIVCLLANTGIRVSECVGIDLTDINFDKQRIRIVRKGGNIGEVVFNNDVAEALKQYITLERPHFIFDEHEKALFLSNRKQRMGVRSIEKMLEKFGNSVLQIGNLHPHTLRKTFGTNLYNSCGDIYRVAASLGHSDVNTTIKHYAAMTEEQIGKNKDTYLYNEESKTESDS